MRRLILASILCLAIPAAIPQAQKTLPSSRSAKILSWGDQGDGTFRNPVLKADYSDPDVTRVGDDFYLIASDFHFVGMQVLHSRDLVNWTIVGQVFDRLDMDNLHYAYGTSDDSHL